MGHIYFELPEIPVPPEGKSAGNRVRAKIDIGGGKSEWQFIGVWAIRGSTFYPNENFRHYFPEYWEKYYGEKPENYYYGIGLYAICLMIGHRTSVYPLLHHVFGPLYGNALYDYAMYSIKERSNVAYLFKPCMESEVIFSKDRNDDDWLSTVFSEKISRDSIYDFRIKWAQCCKEKYGVENVWIAVDGSNSDNQMSNSIYSKRGKAKSGKNLPIVSYIWAVSAKDGLPVTFFMNDGGTTDGKAFIEICEFLDMLGITIEGFILDRGFLSHTVLSEIRGKEYDYLIKLKNDTYAHVNMFKEYAEEIFWKTKYLVGYGGIYGITKGPRKIFGNYSDEAFIGLFFDGKNGFERKVTLSDKILSAKDEAEEQIAHGVKPSVSAEMSSYLEVVTVTEESVTTKNADPCESDEDTSSAVNPKNETKAGQTGKSSNTYRLNVKESKCDQKIFEKGFTGIASSKDLTARQMHETYSLRDISEKQFMIDKTMLGNNVFRSHTDAGILTRELICFLAAIIRNDFENTCRSLKIKPGQIIEELGEKAFLLRQPNGVFRFVDKRTENMKSFSAMYGLSKDDFLTLAGEVTLRSKAHKGEETVSQFHFTPADIRIINHYRKNGKPIPEKMYQWNMNLNPDNGIDKDNQNHTEDQQGNITNPTTETVEKKRGRGRPPGRKNNKTLEKEARDRENGITPPQKRKRGRQFGSKNKKTLERIAAEAANPPKPKKRGRPKGSKDSAPRHRRTKAEMASEN